MANIGEIQKSGDFGIQPSEEKVKSNSENWPLLLKGIFCINNILLDIVVLSILNINI